MSKAVTAAVGPGSGRSARVSGAPQESFARFVGTERAYPGRVERGGQNISVVTEACIAGSLGVSIAALFEGVPAVDVSGDTLT